MTSRRIAAWSVALFSVACTTSRSRPPPESGNVVRADNREFLVFACRGARSAGLRCPAQMPTATYLRGGLVCQAARANTTEATVDSLPPSVCEGLFGGCVAAKPAPPRAAPYALSAAERTRIANAGFHLVPCGDNQFRLDSNEPEPAPPTSQPPQPMADVDASVPSTEPVAQPPADPPQPPPPPQPRSEDPDLVARTNDVLTALMQESITRSTGVGLCHTAPGESLPTGALCVRIEVADNGARPAVIAERFQQIAATSGHPLRLSFSIDTPVPSRCAADDQDCAPIVGAQVCPEAVGFRQGAARSALSTAVNAGMDLSRYESGRCRNDGECYVGGCGQHCVSISTRSFGSTCEGVEAIESAACGCVRGRCRWFLPASN